MSGAIGRQYLLQTWNGASEYSGEMIGNRQRQSTRMYLPNGKANIDAFKEEEPKKGRQKKEEPLEYKLFPQQKAVDKIEAMIEDVEKKYMSFELSDEQYHEAMDVLGARMAKAWLSLCKAKGWTEELEEEEIKKDIGRLGKMIEKQKEKNAREALRMQTKGGRVSHRRPQGTGAVWFIVCLLIFIFFF